MNHFSEKSILITGASSGIGNAIALTLAGKGYTVIAAVRKSTNAEKLKSSGLTNLRPLFPLDLTKPDQIRSAADSIIKEVREGRMPGLFAIVNVAGGGQIAPIELMDISGYRDELEKRIVGPVILLQALLPLLRQSKGRILWIATPGLFPVPFVADIHAPDHAVNYLARTLNLELKPDGIHNILVRCGVIATPSAERTENRLSEMLNIWPEDKSSFYKNRLLKFLQDSKKFGVKRTNPQKVADLVFKILTARKPRIRYRTGMMSGMGAFLEKLPQSWVDFIMMKREGRC
ncbi:MAG: SDR family NAD(P)-dependent oxidoreductase [Bacteroidales bacterium]|jgi:NAD(P)-dependent dehydrogenase (short-subunit alcohol dehydrogenase family)